MIDVSRLVDSITELAVGASDGGFGTDHSVTETETQRFDRPAALVVDGENGSVRVQSGETDDVVVEVTKRAADRADLDRLGVEANRHREASDHDGEDSPLRLAVVRADDTDGAVDLSITLPEGVPVERVTTLNGGIELAGVTVETVETTNGSVTLTDATGDARIETTNGSVTAERVEGFLDVTTANGSVGVSDVTGLDGIETNAGSIDAEVDAIRGDTTIQSRVGSVDIRAGPALDADVTLTTNLGRIDAPAFDADSSGAGRVQAIGTVGDGGDDLRIETRVGRIRLV